MIQLLLVLPIVLAAAVRSNHGSHNGWHGGSDCSCSSTCSGGSSNATVAVATIHSNGSAPVQVNGVRKDGLDWYLGIPFAESPTGQLRFSRPQPKKFSGNVNATYPKPACMQTPSPDGGDYGHSEDCLYLNIMTPPGQAASDEPLPVMLYIHGGGYAVGAASEYLSPALLDFGINTGRPFVFASISYRLGLFGFGYGAEMAANKAGNLGLYDQSLALQWIKDNIAAFGGDPTKVVVFGESAGAISIAIHFLTPGMNFFRGAIMESGAPTSMAVGPPGTTRQAPYNDIVRRTGCAITTSDNGQSFNNGSSADCLRKLSAEALQTALNNQIAASPYAPLPAYWGPSIDGELIPDSPYKLVQEGKYARLPFISGNNKDEGTYFIHPDFNATHGVREFINTEIINPPLSEDTMAGLLQQYPNVPALGCPYDTGNETFGLDPTYKQAASLWSDASFIARRRHFIRSNNQHGQQKVWTYNWEGNGPNGTAPYMGASHTFEIPYVYGRVIAGANYTADDQKLSHTMMNYWINFVYHLDPNGVSGQKGHDKRGNGDHDDHGGKHGGHGGQGHGGGHGHGGGGSSDCGKCCDKCGGGSSGGQAPKDIMKMYWPTHEYPANKNSLRFLPNSLSLMQDDFREEPMAYINSEKVAMAMGA